MPSHPGSLEFEWDRGNAGKNIKHGIEDAQSEEVFFDTKKVLLRDELHSGAEERFILLGKTKAGMLLFIAFTQRKAKIRIISARRANKREVPLYEKAA